MSSVNTDVGRYCVPIALLQYYEMYLCTIVAFLVTQHQDFHSLAFGMEQLPNAIKTNTTVGGYGKGTSDSCNETTLKSSSVVSHT
jgi:hypothetical protein